MKLVQNWRQLLVHAWSARLGYLAGALIGADIGLQIYIGQVDHPSFKLIVAAGVVGAAAFIARFVAQPKMPRVDDADQ